MLVFPSNEHLSPHKFNINKSIGIFVGKNELKNFVYKNNLPLGIVINNSDDVQLVADRIMQLPGTCI